MSDQESPAAYGAEATHADSSVPSARRPAPVRAGRMPDPQTLEFPGCRARRLTAQALEALEEDPKNRFEYWDRDTETVWQVRESVTDAHERPGCRLVECCQVIAASRGSMMECMGGMDLWFPDEEGRKRKILQADQCVYLHPARSRLPDGEGMSLGVHDFPDVVLEVDHTTDIRRGKLGLYEAWGFPEVWVEVPDRYTRSRRRGVRPGVTMWVRGQDGRYRDSPESRAFAGWRAVEVHAAMNEESWTEETCEVLDRVGRRLGTAEGTSPDDLAWVRRHRAEGEAKGRAEGATRERARLMSLLVDKVLGPDYPPDASLPPGLSDEELIDLLRECAKDPGLRARLEASRRG